MLKGRAPRGGSRGGCPAQVLRVQQTLQEPGTHHATGVGNGRDSVGGLDPYPVGSDAIAGGLS